MYFWKSRLRKICLDKCLKGHVSEDPQTENMANGLNTGSNLNDSNFTKDINHFEGECI